jgi:hypothetical protein
MRPRLARQRPLRRYLGRKPQWKLLFIVLPVVLASAVYALGPAGALWRGAMPQLLVSSSSDRSAPAALDGRSLTGPLAVFVAPDPGVSKVTFRLDGSVYRVERFSPFDFDTTTTGGRANLWSPKPGQHTITAEVTTRLGTRQRLTATFVAHSAVAAPTLTPTTTGAPKQQVLPSGPPVTIVRGGTYTGHWRSEDPKVPAVVVATSEPVVIERSILAGKGDLLVSLTRHAKVTIRNSKGYALYPGGSGLFPGRFVKIGDFDSLVVERNLLEGTSGIYLLDWRGDAGAGHTVRVVANRARNIDGRMTNGAGSFSATSFYRVQFVQLAKVRGVPGMEIAWNEVVNEPYQSRVEDNISVYLSSGTPASPLRIHDNYIQGGYTGQASDGAYSGGGIMLGDGQTGSADEASAWVRAYANQVVSTTNYGIGISSGHDLAFYGNRVVGSGRLPDGSPIKAQNVGLYVWNIHDSEYFANNVARDNTVGWFQPSTGARNDWWLPDCAPGCGNNTPLMGSAAITLSEEAAEFQLWNAKVARSAVSVGPDW